MTTVAPSIRGVRVLLIHYTPPGGIGGVEHVMREHVRLLQKRGAVVSIAAGRRGRDGPPVHVIPEMDAARALGRRIEQELAEGVVGETFVRTRDRIQDRLAPLSAEADVIIAHNAFSLHFSLPLTSALWTLAETRAPGSTIAWCHDLAWTNRLYLTAMHDGYPWDQLRRPAPHVRYVTVSQERKEELVRLWGGEHSPVAVIPNGIDLEGFLGLSRDTRRIVAKYGLFDRDATLLLPVRITRRKNVEAGIRAVRALVDRGLDVLFIVSGPVAQHHPARSRTYLDELKSLRSELELEVEVVFLADALGRRLTARTIAELYRVADVLLFPSAQEGFGLPILEAGAARLPTVASDIAIFREVGGADICAFDLDQPADKIAGQIVQALDVRPSRLFRRVRREYRWDAIADRLFVPLVAEASSALEASHV